MELLVKSKNYRLNNIFKNSPLEKLLLELGVTYPNIDNQDKDWILYDAREAYLKLIKEHHPDRGGNPEISTHLNMIWTTIQERLSPKSLFIPDFSVKETKIPKVKVEKVPPGQINCFYCKNLFFPRLKNQKFCSDLCKNRDYHGVRLDAERTCLYCGNTFGLSQYKYRKKFCDNKCKKRYHRKNEKITNTINLVNV